LVVPAVAKTRTAAEKKTTGDQPKTPAPAPATAKLPPIRPDSSPRGSSAGLRLAPHELLISRTAFYVQGLLIAAVGIIGLLLGILIGIHSGPANRATDLGQPIAVHFHFVDRGVGGALVPDEGAVVIVLPMGRVPDPSERLSESDFSPQHGPPSANQIQTLASWGGSYSRADARGDAVAALPRAGEYQTLFIARRAKRVAAAGPSAEETSLLERFFQGAKDLIGDRKYRLSPEQLSNEQKLVHDFDAREH
jgi:hypothetical protein